MDLFTQTVFVIGRLEPHGVSMLGTGFLIHNSGLIATTHHVVGSVSTNLVLLLPNIKDVNQYQNLSLNECAYQPCVVQEIDPFRDIAILKADINFSGILPPLSNFDRSKVGENIAIFGFPHCVEGRRCFTYQNAEIGAKIILNVHGIESKQAVINTQARPGQSGSAVVSLSTGSIIGILVGAWIPDLGGNMISLGGINPRELHQTTHCVSAEYIGEML